MATAIDILRMRIPLHSQRHSNVSWPRSQTLFGLLKFGGQATAPLSLIYYQSDLQ
jgi:hypothetical protein